MRVVLQDILDYAQSVDLERVRKMAYYGLYGRFNVQTGVWEVPYAEAGHEETD